MAKILNPVTLLRKILQRDSRGDKGFKTFDTRYIFNKIYRQSLWGRGPSGVSWSGQGSHEPHIVTPYINAVKEVLATYPMPPSMVDLGCGDFNIGRHFTKDVSTLIACDISDVVLKNNQMQHVPENTVFQQVDLANAPLPKGEVACVRQVLQHLSNENICAFVSALHRETPYHALIVTEHLSAERNFTPNKDKFSGPGTRVHLNSGVDLALPPFSLEFTRQKVLLEIPEPCEDREAILRTTLYTFR